MSSIWKSAVPLAAVISVAVLAPIATGQTATAVEVRIPLLLQLLGSGWLFCEFASVRRSGGAFTAGAAQFFLAVVISLFPQIANVSIPSVAFGLGAVLLFSMLVFPLTWKIYRWRTPGALIIAAVIAALLPLLTAFSEGKSEPLLASGGLAGGILTAVLAWRRRQSRGGLSRVFTVAYLAALVVVLAAAAVMPGMNVALAKDGYAWLLLGNVILALAFVTDQLQSEKGLRSGPHMELEASLKDPLTGLANRRALEIYGPQLIERSHSSGRAISMIMADIDHFKKVNDTYGHPVGDVVLKQTASNFVSQVRKSDMVARYGGEEFIILLPGSPLAPALRLAEKIRSVVEAETITTEGVTLTRTVSFGVTTAFPEEPMSLPDLIKRADANLYRAKREGRNIVRSNALPAQDF